MVSLESIYIVDDESTVREALTVLLQTVGYRVESFVSADAFLAAALPEGPGCVILDVRLPGMSGLQLLESLRVDQPNLSVIILTGHADVSMAVRAFKLGVFDFLEKPFNPQDLLDRIHQAMEHSRKQWEDHAHRKEIRRRYSTLAPREREVLTLLSSGLTTKAIATRLNLSPKTVDATRSRVMLKMGAKSLQQLLANLLLLAQGSHLKPEEDLGDEGNSPKGR